MYAPLVLEERRFGRTTDFLRGEAIEGWKRIVDCVWRKPAKRKAVNDKVDGCSFLANTSKELELALSSPTPTNNRPSTLDAFPGLHRTCGFFSPETRR